MYFEMVLPYAPRNQTVAGQVQPSSDEGITLINAHYPLLKLINKSSWRNMESLC